VRDRLRREQTSKDWQRRDHPPEAARLEPPVWIGLTPRQRDDDHRPPPDPSRPMPGVDTPWWEHDAFRLWTNIYRLGHWSEFSHRKLREAIAHARRTRIAV
jgi:hypothetical protein